jgi:hypothetical protein
MKSKQPDDSPSKELTLAEQSHTFLYSIGEMFSLNLNQFGEKFVKAKDRASLSEKPRLPITLED